MTIKNLYPDISPSLLLDFQNTQRLDPRVTFTRATSATYYDGVTMVKAEENLLARSQEFDNAYWNKSDGSITSTAETAADGTATADTFQATNVGGTATSAVTRGAIIPLVGASYTFSVFVKAGTTGFIQLLYSSAGWGTGAWANFDVSSGVVGTVGASTTASIIDAGAGWYRCVITATATTSGSAGVNIWLVESATAARASAVTQDGRTILIWGAQLEQRSAVTAYTPTTTNIVSKSQYALVTATNNQPRFDHDPITGESLGLLIETSRSNLLTRSENFSLWTNLVNLSVLSDQIIAPDGLLSADKLQENTATSEHYIERNVTPAAGTYTMSIYVKAAEYNEIWFRPVHIGEPSGDTSAIIFNLTTGPTTTSNNLISSASMQDVGNGWRRCIVTLTITAATTTFRHRVHLLKNSIATYAGNGYNGVYVWGAQVEAGRFVTSYIPTAASTASRNTDSASMTGTNFTSWYNTLAGTVYSESARTAADTAEGYYWIWQIANGDGSDTLNTLWRTDTNYLYSTAGVASVEQFQLGTTNSVQTATNKHALAFEVNNFASSLNGATALTDSLGSMPTVIGFYIGSQRGSFNFFGGTVKKLAYYPERLTNSQLQNLTK